MRALKLILAAAILLPSLVSAVRADDVLATAYAGAQEDLVPAPQPEPAYEPGAGVTPEVRAATRRLANYEKCILNLFYPTRLTERASVVNGYPLSVGFDPVLTTIVNLALAQNYGITMGSEMYFPPGQLNTRDAGGMVWLSHEMRHVVQFETFGTKHNFLQAYAASVGAGVLSGEGTNQAYLNSLFEQDARVAASAFSDLLYGERDLSAALGAPDRDRAVCELVDAKGDAYRARISAKTAAHGRKTLRFPVGMAPFISLVTYTFYTE